MKALVFNIILVCFVVSCATQRNSTSSGVSDLERYDKETTVFIDNLQREAIPSVLKKFYYSQLQDKDFLQPQSIIQENKRVVDLKSKQAKDGYLYINEYSNTFIVSNKNVLILVGQDTIDTRADVEKLIKMKRNEVINIDTLKKEEYAVIKIN